MILNPNRTIVNITRVICLERGWVIGQKGSLSWLKDPRKRTQRSIFPHLPKMLSGKSLAIVGLILLGFYRQAFPSEVAAQADFYVAPNGNDSNSGILASPFASVERAQQAVRERIAAGLTSNLTVHIRQGVYELSKPLVFTPQDSGTIKYSITYAAYTGERVVISGGRRITGWKQEDTGLWSTIIPDVAEGKWYFRSLFVNDQRATRARKPNASYKEPYYKLQGVGLTPDKSAWVMTLAAGQVSNWKNISEVELVVVLPWDIIRKRLQHADPASSMLILAPPYLKNDWRLEPHASWYCYLENARAFLDQPGEWYLDRSTGTLSYWPKPGEDMANAEVIAPRMERLFEIRGTASYPVRNLHFIGLQFFHTNSELPSQGFVGIGGCYGLVNPYPQLTTHLPEDAIRCVFAQSCSFENGALAHLGGDGVHLGDGCIETLWQGNRIFDIGANGILVGGGRANQVINNIISDCGIVYYAGCGIQVGGACQTLIAHNLIRDTGGHGIVLGGSQKPPPPGTHDGNRLENNCIINAVKMLSDGGCIYMWGIQTNGVIRGNVVRDMPGPQTSYYNQINGLYFDDNSRGYLVESNVVYGTKGKGLKFINSASESHTIRDNFWYGPNRFLKQEDRYALSFAAESLFDFPHQTCLEPPSLTVEAWVNLTTVPVGSDPSAWIVCKNTNELTDGNYALLISHNNVGAYLNIGSGRENSYAAWSSTSPITTSTWHLLAMTYDGKDLKVYCDGKLNGSTSINRQRSTGRGLLRIGKRADGYNPFFPGLVEQIRIYSRALSTEEIAAQFSRVVPKSDVAVSAQPPGINPPTSDLRSTDSRLPSVNYGLVLDWNANAVHSEMERILSAAGPQEPYRSRFAETREQNDKK